MRVPQTILDVPPPPLHQLHEKARELVAKGSEVISLGQAIPAFVPPKIAMAAIRNALSNPSTHKYSQDEGLPELRQALARKLLCYNHVQANPDGEIIITGGGNQAFVIALLTLTEVGDDILLPAPYFVNHATAIRICGRNPIEVPLREKDGFQLKLDAVKRYVTSRTRALVVVSPNNPTGAVYEKEELFKCAEFMTNRGIFTVADEAYEFFLYDGAEHFSVASVPELSRSIVTIGTFSKTFGMTGWRIGYFVADREICAEAIKVHNSLLICAPVPSQIAVLAALKVYEDFVTSSLNDVRACRLYAKERIDAIPYLSWHPTSGAFFAFVRVESHEPVDQLANDILESVHLLVVPGILFGQHGEGYLRLSYGSLSGQHLRQAFDRLEKYFSSTAFRT